MAYFGLGDDAKKEQLKQSKAAACAAQGGTQKSVADPVTGVFKVQCVMPNGKVVDSGGGGDGTIFGIPPLAIIGGLAVIGVVASQIVARRKKAAA